jgi:hypothetical protein
LLGSWKKRWLRLVPETFTFTLGDAKDGPVSTEVRLDAGGVLFTTEMLDNKPVLTVELARDTWQFQLDTEDERTMWALHFQYGVLGAKPVTDRGRELYEGYYKLEEAASALRGVLSLSDKDYKGDGQTFVHASHLTEAQEGMADLMSNLSLMERRFGEGGELWGPHWDSILAPYVNLVPRAGMAMSTLQKKQVIHGRISAYHSEKLLATNFLRMGKAQQGRQHWGGAVKQAEALLTDTMFLVKLRREKNFTTNASGTAVSASSPEAEQEQKRLPEVETFQAEYDGQTGEMVALLDEAEGRTRHWRWYCLSNQVTQAFEGLDRLMAIASRPYFPPYAEAPSLTSDLVDAAEKQCEHVRARLDTFIRASHMLTAQSSKGADNEVLEREQQWSEGFTGDTAHRWKTAKDSIKHLRVLSKDHQVFHRFSAIACRVPSLAMAGQLSVADLTWSEARQCGLVVISKNSSSPSRTSSPGADQRVLEERDAFENYYHATKKEIEVWLSKAKEEDELERSGETEEHVDGEEEDLLSPEACVKRSEWWLKQALLANQVPFEYPPRDTGSCVVPSTVSLAVLCRNAFRCTLSELQHMYAGVWEIEPFFTECERRYAKAGDAIAILSVRELVHRNILRYMALCEDMTYLTAKRQTRREVHMGEEAEEAEEDGPDAKQLENAVEAMNIGSHLQQLLKKHGGKAAEGACLVDDLQLFVSLHAEQSAVLGLDTPADANGQGADDHGESDGGHCVSPVPILGSNPFAAAATPIASQNPFGSSPSKLVMIPPVPAKATPTVANPFSDSEDEGGGSIADFLGDDAGGSASSAYADLAEDAAASFAVRRKSMAKMLQQGRKSMAVAAAQAKEAAGHAKEAAAKAKGKYS